MNQNMWFAMVEKENVNGSTKYCSFTWKVSRYTNFVHAFDGLKNLIVAHPCDTKKQAHELVRLWNESYRQNGNYLFDNEPLFKNA